MKALVAALTMLVLFTSGETDAGPRRRAVRHPSSVIVLPETSIFTPSKDNTLYQTTTGSLSNGAGIHIFAGTTGTGDARRAVLAFDLASRIPPGSLVTRVELTLHVSQTISGAVPVSLHRLRADWGEGTSDAGESRDGTGASSSAGDATWVHAFFPDRRWQAAGADFVDVADATAAVSNGFATWSSSATLVARVQEWVDQPAGNFGWILIGDESAGRTAKRFDSREIPNEALRPTLVVEWMRQ